MDLFDDIQRPRLREAAVPLKSRAIHVYPLNCYRDRMSLYKKMKGDILFVLNTEGQNNTKRWKPPVFLFLRNAVLGAFC